MNWDSLHYWLHDENSESGHTLRTYTIGKSNGDELGMVYCSFSKANETASFRIEIGDAEVLRWECKAMNKMGGWKDVPYSCEIEVPSLDWCHHLKVPVEYHAPGIFEFDDGKTRLRLAKVGKRFGDFFVVDNEGTAHPWIAGNTQSFLVLIAFPCKPLLHLITFMRWNPEYNQPLIGSSELSKMTEVEQTKAVVLTATIRMWLDESDFSRNS